MYSGERKFVNPSEFSMFQHKHHLKHHRIFTLVLKVDKENTNTWHKNIILGHLSITQKSQKITYL